MFSKPPLTAPLVASFLLSLTSLPQFALAGELPVNLGAAANFGVLAGSTVTSSGATIINGDLGLWPGTAVSGFPPGIVNGTMHVNDPIAQAAEGDLTIAFNDAAGRSTAPVSITGDIGGMTLTPGLYKSSSGLAVSIADLTLDAQGDPNAVFIFQMATTLVTGSGRQVILIGGAQAANIFWQVGTSATLGTTSGMKGNILADQSISIKTGATLQGRALARIAAVSLEGNGVNIIKPLPGGGGGGGTNQVSTNLFVFFVSPIVLNRQTGLFEQTVRLTNGSVNTITAARLLIQALPADVQVYNASGSDSGTPFVQYSVPLPPAATVDLVIEYYRWTRVQIPQPAFVAVDGTPAPVTDTGPIIQIDRNVQFENGRFIIEFSSTPGSHYAVQYTSDMETWKTATPIITAPANKVQWYDDGPPKTESKPTTGSRFYRIMQLP